jgi:hypothetical protein
MKIEEVIEELQKIQKLYPGIDVTDGSAAVYFVDVLPAWYDWCYTRLRQDESITDEYNIIGAKIISEGDKCVFHFMSARDLCAMDDAMWSPDYFEYDENSRMKEKRIIDEQIELAKATERVILHNKMKMESGIQKGAKVIQAEKGSLYHFYRVFEGGIREKIQPEIAGMMVVCGFFDEIDMGEYVEWKFKGDVDDVK